MLRRLLAIIAFAVVSLAPSQGRAQEPAQMEAAIAAMGGWTRDYQVVMARAVEPFTDMSGYTTALERFGDGAITQREARAAIETWRASALESVRQARATAQVLAPPPDFSIFGPDGARLSGVTRHAHEAISPTIDEIERVIEACAELGFAALNDRAKGYEARERALYNASLQLTRIDRARIDLTVASLSPDHPTQALAVATQHYYDTLDVFPRFLLAQLDGAGDRAALLASLRASAIGMQRALSDVSVRAAEMGARSRELQAGSESAIRLGRVMVRLLETYPPTVSAYQGLMAGIEGAARDIEAGADVSAVWTGLEASDRPHLNEIDRLDRLRANMLSDISRQSL